MSIPAAGMSPTTMTVDGKELRAAAVRALRWGWPVTPGTFLGAEGLWRGREGAMRLCPLEDAWQEAPVTTPERVEEVWSRQPYGVLLVCGRGVDVLELPYRMRELLGAPELAQVPVAVTGFPPRWLLFTATGSNNLSADLDLARVRLHGAGSWVALPPTVVAPLCTARWIEPPQHNTVGLIIAEEVQHALLQVLLRSGVGTGPGDDDD